MHIAHQLKIETGHYDRKYNPFEICFESTTPQERKWDKCDSGEVEHELHFLVKCNNYKYQRQLFFSKWHCTNLNNLSDDNQFIWLMSNENKDTIKSVAEFIFNSMKLRGYRLTNYFYWYVFFVFCFCFFILRSILKSRQVIDNYYCIYF